jgi:hypothetical protein
MEFLRKTPRSDWLLETSALMAKTGHFVVDLNDHNSGHEVSLATYRKIHRLIIRPLLGASLHGRVFRPITNSDGNRFFGTYIQKSGTGFVIDPSSVTLRDDFDFWVWSMKGNATLMLVCEFHAVKWDDLFGATWDPNVILNFGKVLTRSGIEYARRICQNGQNICIILLGGYSLTSMIIFAGEHSRSELFKQAICECNYSPIFQNNYCT